MRTETNGFTLTELLVVIAVIGILAAMLVPGLNRAKLAADSAVCRSNLRQITIGISIYVQQSGVYPVGAELIRDLYALTGAVWPADNYRQLAGSQHVTYLGPGQGIYACAGYNRIRGQFASVAAGPPRLPDLGAAVGSYGYNTVGAFGWVGLDGPGPTYSGARETLVLAPSDMIAVGDTTLRWSDSTPYDQNCAEGLTLLGAGWVAPYHAKVLTGKPASDPAVRAMAQRHSSLWNMGFCDAHVESLRPKQLFDEKNPTVKQRWNADHQPHLGPD